MQQEEGQQALLPVSESSVKAMTINIDHPAYSFTDANGNIIKNTGYWNPLPPKSSICPFCTPRCPHGYPADVAPTQPVITWSNLQVPCNTTEKPEEKK
jgi:hypothetical protein